jgi:hypothetical protein
MAMASKAGTAVDGMRMLTSSCYTKFWVDYGAFTA